MFFLTGDYLFSQAVSNQVPSAYRGLTAVCGMGTGGSPQLSPPDSRHTRRLRSSLPCGFSFPHNCITRQMVLDIHMASVRSQGLGRFVSVSSILCRTSTPDRSTLSSTGGLTLLRDERSHLKAGFTLRCFQRFSVPNVATQLYPWRDNWYTIGSSTPVLSY